MTDDSYHMPIYALVLVSESVSESVMVKFSALYLVSKVSEKSGIGPPLNKTIVCLVCMHCYVILSNTFYLFHNILLTNAAWFHY